VVILILNINPQGVKNIELIKRWRWKSAGGMAKYKKANCLNLKNKLFYYITPATPKKMAAIVIAGVIIGQKLLKAAGF